MLLTINVNTAFLVLLNIKTVLMVTIVFFVQNTLNLPAGLSIPQGSILMKNDQGQLMLVPGGSHINSSVRQVLQVQVCYLNYLCRGACAVGCMHLFCLHLSRINRKVADGFERILLSTGLSGHGRTD